MKDAWIREAVAALSCGAATLAVAGTLAGSKHDFSLRAGSVSGGGCAACHIPAEPPSKGTPGWAPPASAILSYAIYANGNSRATAQPGTVSKICLSCHDGTVALDTYSERAEPSVRGVEFGRELAHGHPIGLAYDSASAIRNASMFDPDRRLVSIGSDSFKRNGTVSSTLLFDGHVECTSCHDPHNRYTVAAPPGYASNKLLKLGIIGSGICMTCHNK